MKKLINIEKILKSAQIMLLALCFGASVVSIANAQAMQEKCGDKWCARGQTCKVTEKEQLVWNAESMNDTEIVREYTCIGTPAAEPEGDPFPCGDKVCYGEEKCQKTLKTVVEDEDHVRFEYEYDCVVSNTEDKMSVSAGLGESSLTSKPMSRDEAIETYCYQLPDNKCLPYCKYDRVDSCLLCPIYGVIFNTVSRIGAAAIQGFSNSVVRIVVIGFGIWLAIQILLFVSSTETRDLKDLMQSIITQGFVVLLVAMIIKTGVADFFETFVNPVYLTGQKMAQTMFTSCGDNPEAKIVVNDDGTKKCVSNTTTMTAYNESTYIKSVPDGLPRSMGDSVIQTMTAMENYVRKFKAIGSSLMCQSWKEKWIVFPKFIFLVTGLAIWVLSMIIILGVPFLMIDSVFQLGVAAALLPIAVGGFAFKSTRQYTKKVWETFLNSMFSFLFITIIVLLLMSILQVSITQGIEEMGKGDANFNFESLFILDGNGSVMNVSFDTMLKSFSWSHPGFLKLATIFLLAWAVMNAGKEFADEFASSISSTSIGSDIGTMAASTTKGMVGKATKPLLKSAGKRISQGAVNLTGRVVKAPKRLVKRGIDSVRRRKLERKEKETGKAMYQDRLGRTHVLENGVETIKTTRVGRNGELQHVEVKNTRDLSIETIRTREMVNGQLQWVTKKTVDVKSSRMDRLISSDGKVDTKLMAKMLEGITSKEERDAVRLAIHQKVMEKRFGSNIHNHKDSLQRAPEIVSQNEETGEMIVKIVNAKGEVIFQRSKINKHGYMETEMIKADKQGKVTTLSSDGMRNRMSSARLSSNDLAKFEAAGNALNVAEKDIDFDKSFNSALEKDDNGRIKKQTSYSYSRRMQERIDRGARPETIGFDEDGNPLGIMSMEEAVGKRTEEGWQPGAFDSFVHSKGNEFRKADMEINFHT